MKGRILRSVPPLLAFFFISLLTLALVPTSQALWSKTLGISGTIQMAPAEPPESEGCTPGFWKQEHHLEEWPEAFSPDDGASLIFGNEAFGDLTLSQVLEQGGGGVIALLRHAVAGLLNAAHESVNYPFSVAEVFGMTQAASSGGDVETTKGTFEAANELGCPLDGDDEDDEEDENENGEKDEKENVDSGAGDEGERDDNEKGDGEENDNNDEKDVNENGDNDGWEEDENSDSGDEEGDEKSEEEGNDDRTGDDGDQDPAPENYRGCDPSYWGSADGLSAWPDGISPVALVSEVFGVEILEGLTLNDALSLEGDGVNGLMREATAALLNAVHEDVNYPFRVEEIVSTTQAALSDGDVEAATDIFEAANELACPLDDDKEDDEVGDDSEDVDENCETGDDGGEEADNVEAGDDEGDDGDEDGDEGNDGENGDDNCDPGNDDGEESDDDDVDGGENGDDDCEAGDCEGNEGQYDEDGDDGNGGEGGDEGQNGDDGNCTNEDSAVESSVNNKVDKTEEANSSSESGGTNDAGESPDDDCFTGGEEDGDSQGEGGNESSGG